MIVYAHLHDSRWHALLVMAAIVSVGAVVLLVFRLAPLVATTLKQTGMSVATRLMGLIAATAVEFIVDGVSALFPALVK